MAGLLEIFFVFRGQEVIPKPDPLMDQLLSSVRKMEYIREAWNRFLWLVGKLDTL